MTAAELIIKYLEEMGVRYIFGIPGGALEPLYDAINKSERIEAVLPKHEEGASFMADGYSRVSNMLGVCCATTGPGSTNLITGIASSYADSIPVLTITAQVPTRSFGKGALQESTYDGINIVEIFRHFTKFSAMVITPEKTGEMLRQALRIALSGRRGPVHLNIPMDVMREDVDEEVIPHDKFIPHTMYFDRYSIKMAATLLLNAKKPAILLGNGTLISGAVDEVIKFAEMLSIPVVTTPKAKGAFPENHDLSLGVFGLGGSPQAEGYLLNEELRIKNEELNSTLNTQHSTLPRVDVLLAIGTSFNEWGSNAWDKRLIPENAMIQVDIDPYEFGKNYPFEVDLIGDAKTIIREMTYELERQIEKLPPLMQRKLKERRKAAIEELHGFKGQISRHLDVEKMGSDTIPLKPQRLMKDLRDSLPQDTIFFTDIGNNLVWALHYLDIYKPYTFFAGLGFASMGYGVAAAVGGKFAAPDRPVVAIVGDGGFLMNGMEVATAINYNKQIIWVVENNSELGMVSHGRRLAGMKHTNAAEFGQVDFVKIAEGLGARGVRVTKPGEINRKFMDDIIATGKSTVIDVMIDRNEVPPL
ncbi:MAG: thiamine pyrophosphate-binding protein, partial [Nitrospinae bacterium]|nr:thiamine pyrophosphate-binding protein [Nitrospinota bacterium]